MKINIHPLTIILTLITFLCGRFNYFLIILTIILFHDLGHLCIMKLFKIKVSKLTILPFGSIIDSDLKYNENTLKKILIAIAGVLFQIILYLIFIFLSKQGFITYLTYQIFLKYNKYIILFNLLPIIPLDGSQLLSYILETFLPFKLSIYLKCIISIIFLILLLLISNPSLDLLNIIILSFYKTYEELLNIKIIYYKFLLERYLERPNFKKVKYVHNIDQIFKNRLNFIGNIKEITLLTKKFEKKQVN